MENKFSAGSKRSRRLRPRRAGQAGPEQAGPEQAGPEQAGPEQAGPRRAEPGRAGKPQTLSGIAITPAAILLATVLLSAAACDSSRSSLGTAAKPQAESGLTARLEPATTGPAPIQCRSCWRPSMRESWQIELSVTPSAPFPKVRMFEVDGFDTPASVVAALHRSLPGRGVVCYIDAGTWENWRPDAAEFPAALLGKSDGGWPGERWLNIAAYRGALGRIMLARAKMCKNKGFNAIDFDNVDGYDNDTGFHLTASDQEAYDIFLANAAHRLGLSVALKNDVPQIPELLRFFDFAVDEQCFQYADCLSWENGGKYGLNEFTAAGKPIFDIEYGLRLSRFCPAANRNNFNALAKRLNLGPWRESCR